MKQIRRSKRIRKRARKTARKTVRKTVRKTARKTVRKTARKYTGGNTIIPNYGLNTYQTDPQHMQISSRNIVQQGGSGKRSRRRGMKGGDSSFSFLNNQILNPITNFISSTSTNVFNPNNTNLVNSAPYIQPIGNKALYT